MNNFIAFTIIGLSTGAIYAIAASGLVLTYATSGIFNLSHGATGMLSAFVYWQLRFDWGWPAPIALLVTLLIVCPLYGALVEKFLMRGLRDTSEVVKLSVTVALLVAAIGLANWVWPPGNYLAFQGFFEGNTVSVFGYNLSWHKIITAGCAVIVAVVLRLLLFRTRAGVAMRAVVDDRDLLTLNGGRPERVSMLAWAGGASLGGLAGILMAGEQQLNIVPLTLLVVNAYAAAIFGRLSSLPFTFLGAVVLGLIDSYYVAYSGSSWFPNTFFGYELTGLRASVPTILLFIVLLVLPQTRLRAGAAKIRERSRAPRWPTSILGAVLLITVTVAVSGMLTGADTLYLVDAMALAIIALSLVPVTGYAGQVSLAPITFAGLGAMFMVHLPGHGSVLTLLATVLIVSLIGAVIALPALRVQGIYLALATGAFAIFTSNLVFQQRRTFPNGAVTVPALDIPGLDLSTPQARLIELATAFALLGLSVVALRRSRLGRRLVALRDSSIAAATLGMNLTLTKLSAFAISAGIAACGGALFGASVTTDRYTFSAGLPVVLLAVVGGVGAVSGALFGGILLGGNAIMAGLVPSLTKVTQVLPGLVGIGLGRDPDGVTTQLADRYRPLRDRWGLVVLCVAGGLLAWGLTSWGVLNHWQFGFTLIIWTLAVAPNLPALLSHPSSRRRLIAVAWLVLGVALCATVNWDQVFANDSWLVLVLVIFIAAFGTGTQRLLEYTRPSGVESPDDIGLRHAFLADEVERIDRSLGVVL
jgi:branched-chain amino acid transport system permease protein